MGSLTATEASRRFSDLLDSVEHKGTSYTIVRHGKAVARLVPHEGTHGKRLKEVLRSHRVDPDWKRDLLAVRRDLLAPIPKWPTSF